MSLGPMMIGIAGLELTAQEREYLAHPAVGGVILFTRNYHDLNQLEALVGDIHRQRNPHLIVSVDHEGGRVQRFREGFTRLPAMRPLGDVYDRDPKRAKHLAELSGWLMAAELRAVDVDISFAPVLDLDGGCSQIIGDRAFHGDPRAVAELAQAYMRGMNQAGMMATGKHFPGHGNVAADTHIDVTEDPRPYEDIYAEDLFPFERLIRGGIAAIMAAHVIYPAVDPRPAGFSPFWVREVLRGRLGFQGVIISDDLGMEGANVCGDLPSRAHAALEAGCDAVLLCNELEAVGRVLDDLEYTPDPASHLRLARLHGRHAPDRTHLRLDPRWHEALAALDEYRPSDTMSLV